MGSGSVTMSDFSVNDPDSYSEYARWDSRVEDELLDYVVDLDDEPHIVRGSE